MLYRGSKRHTDDLYVAAIAGNIDVVKQIIKANDLQFDFSKWWRGAVLLWDMLAPMRNAVWFSHTGERFEIAKIIWARRINTEPFNLPNIRSNYMLYQVIVRYIDMYTMQKLKWIIDPSTDMLRLINNFGRHVHIEPYRGHQYDRGYDKIIPNQYIQCRYALIIYMSYPDDICNHHLFRSMIDSPDCNHPLWCMPKDYKLKYKRICNTLRRALRRRWCKNTTQRAHAMRLIAD